ncbi:HAD-IA family hydrolase [Faunimonas sp. B44]|uniref:HAD-IA family hydrolase n=1 Tax=Faunimonas sp. B44 TaxID=3461493 RepID=UPI004043BBEE
MALEALIFDVDGTLAETEECHRRAFNDAFAELGLDWHWDRALYRRLLLVTGGKERLRHFIDEWSPPEAESAAERLLELHAAKTRRYTELVDAGALELRPGVRDLLEAAAGAGLRLAIATTTTPANIEALLRSTLGPAGPGLFHAIAAGDDAELKKPAPDVYLIALQRLGLGAEQCLAFEDSEQGLQAAIGAGIATIVTPGVYTSDHDFTGALEVRADLAGFDLHRMLSRPTS